nr:condensin complex subunit 2 [Ipomoea batatas]
MAETLSPNPKLRAPVLSHQPVLPRSPLTTTIERAQHEMASKDPVSWARFGQAIPPQSRSSLLLNNRLPVHGKFVLLKLECKILLHEAWIPVSYLRHTKSLERINRRVGRKNEQDPVVEDANIDNEQSGDNPKKEQSRKLSPLSTLESSFEALNVKKFDDPLYHQTSAQFDEGGAKGLLLNNLGVYGLCRVLFDSLEVPGKCTPTAVQSEGSEVIDVSFAKDCIEEMVLNMSKKDEISPSLRHIIHQFDEDACRLSETYVSAQNSSEQDFDTIDHAPEADNDVYDNYGAWAMDNDDETSVADQATYEVDQSEPGQQEVNERNLVATQETSISVQMPSEEQNKIQFTLHTILQDGEPLNYRDAEMDDRPDQVDDYLFLSLGFSSKQNLWAGPDHWKYRKVKVAVSDVPSKEEGSPPKNKKTKSKKAECDIDFTKALDTDLSHIFDPPKNPKSLLLPVNRAPSNRLLPEDCHYQPEDLVKLFLLPNVMEEASQLRDDCGTMPSWDDDCGFDGTFDDGSACSDVEDPSTLVSQPRQVNKIDIHYDKTSKQVDVQVLKETLWDQIQGLNQTSVQDESVSFKQVLATFPDDCRATGSHDDISPHLCFICLLHLANEHGLCIQGSVNLDDLRIKIAAHNSSVQDAAI